MSELKFAQGVKDLALRGNLLKTSCNCIRGIWIVEDDVQVSDSNLLTLFQEARQVPSSQVKLNAEVFGRLRTTTTLLHEL